ncbi:MULTISPECIES: extracellular solute-binding protein [unclassified Anabaena]|uniref:extracellular solute-binding protein n=1 Tax=unclassified Anabaena TaxID=2619674 RepID=UPI0039C72A5D
MILQKPLFIKCLTTAFCLLALVACRGNFNLESNLNQLSVQVLVGSALADFCQQAAQNFHATQPRLDNGRSVQVRCDARGSGDVVNQLVSLATQLRNGTLQADAVDFPTIISLDGDIYHSQMIYHINQLFPGQRYIPTVTESPLIAHTPMVFMAQSDVAEKLRKSGDILSFNYVQTAPTLSNSGLQTLVAQYASVSGKSPEDLTLADVQQLQPQMQKIYSQIPTYGVSTNSLAEAIAQNGQFGSVIASVYESSVIAVNSRLPAQLRYEAVYPSATFTSNMRAIVPNAPWVSVDENAAADKFITYWRSPAVQQIATDLGLRPGTPGVALGEKFTPEFGVDPQAKYDSLRPPSPEVVEAMLKAWQEETQNP